MNEYKTKIETKQADKNNLTRCYLDASFQGATKVFGLAFDNTTTGANNTDGPNRVKRDSHRKYFLLRVNITNYSVLIDERNFYDQPMSDQIKNYDEIRNIFTGKGDD